ncbi:MAG: glycosyltransferase [Dehalococcoidia bacterium]|nr:glycosyltransferase [Dehalococcoidia bacterium]
MLNKVSLGIGDLQKYRLVLGNDLIDEIEQLADDLKDVRICHVNSTSFGGGVAELLSSLIPLVRSVGLTMDWQVIHGDRRFFTITKIMHNALQGADGSLIQREETDRLYKTQNQMNAREMDCNYDVLIINDPQPAALRHFSDDMHAKWIWRCHIDTSEPDAGAWSYLRPYIEQYDAAVFTMDEFVPRDLRAPIIATMAPAIDAFSAKNMSLPRSLCREMTDNLGIDRERPLILQVSRFDPWKDPFGVIMMYRFAKEKVPGLQLALVGSLASDDPEGWGIYASIHTEADKDKDVHVFTNMTGVGSMQVNAFQTACDVAIQRSIREGFGLVVSEALWKGIPVVAGNAGGIPMQMTGNLSNYLINTLEEGAEKVVYLLQNRETAVELGKEGKENVKRNFLMPRLIRDELSLVKRVLAK